MESMESQKAGFSVPTLFGNPLRISHLPTASIVTVIYLKTSKAGRKPAMQSHSGEISRESWELIDGQFLGVLD
jgi:hypothetical protein